VIAKFGLAQPTCKQKANFGQSSGSLTSKVVKMEFAHIGRVLHTMSRVCDGTCHRNYHLPFYDL